MQDLASIQADEKIAKLEVALKNLLDFVVSGRRYEVRNPYTIDEVRAAFRALGLTEFGD